MMNKKVVVIGVAGVVLLGGAAIAYPFVHSMQVWGKAAAQLPEARQRAKAMGLPVEPSDMKRNPPVTPGDNAAPLIRQASESLTKDPAVKKAASEIEKSSKDIIAAGSGANEAKAFLAKYGPVNPVLDVAAKASECRDCDLDYDWAQGPDLLFPELAGCKSLVKLLTFRAEANATLGNLDSALADLKTASRLGYLIGRDSTLIHMLVNIACDAIAMRGYELVLTQSANNPAALQRVGNELSNLPPMPEMLRALRGEVMFGIVSARRIRTYADLKAVTDPPMGIEDNKRPQEPSKGPPTDMSKACEAAVLKYWCSVYEATTNAKDASEVGKALDAAGKAVEKSKDPTDVLMAVLLPVFSQAGDAVVKMDANRRCATALASVMAYRAKNGKLPKTLAEAGVTATDPFDGKPLRYWVSGDTCRVYSIGTDRTDDGGLRFKKSGTSAMDIVAQFPYNLKRSGEN